MRTNIDIDDHLLAEAMAATGLKTKKAVVEEGLRTLARLQRQAAAGDLGLEGIVARRRFSSGEQGLEVGFRRHPALRAP